MDRTESAKQTIFDSHKCYLVGQQCLCLLLHGSVLCLLCQMERPVVRTMWSYSVHEVVSFPAANM